MRSDEHMMSFTPSIPLCRTKWKLASRAAIRCAAIFRVPQHPAHAFSKPIGHDPKGLQRKICGNRERTKRNPNRHCRMSVSRRHRRSAQGREVDEEESKALALGDL